MAKNVDSSKCSSRSVILDILRRKLEQALLRTKHGTNWVWERHGPGACNDHARVKGVYRVRKDAYGHRMLDESGCEGYN